MAKTLRDYQKRACRVLYDYIKGPDKHPVLASLPTASGKTLILGTVAKYAGVKALMVVPNVDLLNQNLKEAKELGVDGLGVYSASANTKEIGDYLTIATMGSIKLLGKMFKEQGIKILYIDECHIGTDFSASMFKTFVKELKPERVIGVSGTIYRLVSTMAGSKLVLLNKMRPKFFKKIIHVTQISELTEKKYWTPIEYEVHPFDGSKLEFNTTGAEFTKESVSLVLNELGINNKIFLRVRQLIETGYTSVLVFVDSVESAITFAEHTPLSACLHSNTPKKERKRIISDYKAGKIKVIYNVKILTTGFDYPELQVVIQGYPTNSMSLYSQIIGRGVRICDGKLVFRYIDMCGNVERFGRVEEQKVINDPELGWVVMTKGDRVITGVPLGYPIFKSDLVAAQAPGVDLGKMGFGKWKGRKIESMCEQDLRYAQYIVTIMDAGAMKNAVKEGIKRKIITDFK